MLLSLQLVFAFYRAYLGLVNCRLIYIKIDHLKSRL